MQGRKVRRLSSVSLTSSQGGAAGSPMASSPPDLSNVGTTETFIAADDSVTAGTALGVIDDGLVLRSQAGDPAATSELVRLARPILQRYARRFFPDPARAEDMAQTALMKAFARMGDL